MNINEKVAVERCAEYDTEKIYAVLRKEALGIGLAEDEIKGKKIVIKPNLLLAYDPSKAATTHPAVVEAAIMLLRSLGAEDILIAESPGGTYTEKSLDHVYEITGMKKVSKRTGVQLNYGTASQEFHTPDGKQSKVVTVIKPICDADVILNVCKMKTHSFAMMTGAAKNLFGVIPGITKFEMHARFKVPRDFFSMIIDINEALHSKCSVISICDGITAMEGDGPSGGTPRQTGLLLMSRNPFTLDAAATEIMGLSGKVGILRLAAERGYCPQDPDKLSICGVPLKEAKNGDFILPDTALGKKFDRIPPFLQPRPEVNRKACKSCGLCIKNCPQKTIKLYKNKARIDLKNCIKCYCCQELCTFKAIKIRKNFIYKYIK